MGDGQAWEADREARRQFFDTVAAEYDAVRPAYPDEMYADLEALGVLRPTSRVLEIGCGTGQATRALARRAASVTAVELGSHLAALARDRLAGLPSVEVIEGDAASVDLPVHAFDLIVSATAWHWLEPAEGVARAHTLLAPGGAVALWWHVFADPDRPDPFGDRISPVLDAMFPSRANTSLPYALDRDRRIAELTAGDRFGPVAMRTYPWEGRHDSIELARLFGTFSTEQDMSAEDNRRRMELVRTVADEEFGGHVVRPYLTVLYVAHRLD